MSGFSSLAPLILHGGGLTHGQVIGSSTPDGGKPEFVLEAGSKQMNAGVFSPDGRHILTGAHDGALRVWDAADGSPVKSFDWQIGPVTAVAFAPDGLTCAAAGTNGRVVLWDVDE